MERDLVDELYKIAYKRYREKYPNKDFASIPNFLDSLWFSIEGELNRNGYDAARKYVEEAELIVLRWMKWGFTRKERFLYERNTNR